MGERAEQTDGTAPAAGERPEQEPAATSASPGGPEGTTPGPSAAGDDEPPRWRRLLWHGAATPVLVGVVWWAFAWQLSALQWLGLLLIAIVLWHALQGRGRMRPLTRWLTAGAVLAAGVATLPLDQPWNAPWWPGSKLAGSVPDPCEAAAGHLPGLVPGAGDPTPGGYADLAIDWQTCGWQSDDRMLYLEFRRYPWQGTDDKSVATARRALAERREHADAEPLDIGEEAYADPLADTRLAIEARQANVIVTVRYYAEDGAAPLSDAERAVLAELAADAVDLLP